MPLEEEGDGVEGVAEDAAKEAHLLGSFLVLGIFSWCAARSAQQQFLNLVRGTPGLLPPPVDTMDGLWSPHERAHVDRMTRCSAVGSPETVQRWLEKLAADTQADELIIAGQIYSPAARLQSFELVTDLHRRTVPVVEKSG